MRHTKTNETGFTLIELLVVGIIVGILVTLVAMTYSGVQAKNRNAERQARINDIQSQLEIYFAENNKYPSLEQINDATWRKTNVKNLKDESLRDPQWDKNGSCNKNDKARLTDAPVEKCYSYEVRNTDGALCDNNTVTCLQYTLTATFEGTDKYVKTSLN